MNFDEEKYVRSLEAKLDAIKQLADEAWESGKHLVIYDRSMLPLSNIREIQIISNLEKNN